MTRPRVVGMGMRDHRPIDRAGRIDEEVARLAVQPLRQDAQPMSMDVPRRQSGA